MSAFVWSKCSSLRIFCVDQRFAVFSLQLLLLKEVSENFVIFQCDFSTLFNGVIFYLGNQIDLVYFLHYFYEFFKLDILFNHRPFRMSVQNASYFLFLLDFAHVNISSIQIIFRRLGVKVQCRPLFMLFRTLLLSSKSLFKLFVVVLVNVVVFLITNKS